MNKMIVCNCLMVFMFSCVNGEKNYDYVDEVHKIIGEVSNEMKKEKLHLIGSGGALKDCIEVVTLTYIVYENFSEEQVTHWICVIMDKMITKILSSKIASGHLCSKGFNTKNVYITIYNNLEDNDINMASVSKDVIEFEKFSNIELKTKKNYEKILLLFI